MSPDVDAALAGSIENVERLGVLRDENRRRIYAFVRDQKRPVGRDEVAEAVGLPRRTSTFHLEKLLSAGLLTADFRRPPGRSGPGAGRPAKIYRPTNVEVSVSIPPRAYDLVGEILVGAIERSRSRRAREESERLARGRGRELGRHERARDGGRSRGRRSVFDLLRRMGYEPFDRGSQIDLRSCPFHSLAQRAPDLICPLNTQLLQGVLDEIAPLGAEAVLTRPGGNCCVTVLAAGAREVAARAQLPRA